MASAFELRPAVPWTVEAPPEAFPTEVARYAGEPVPQLPVGSAGKVGILQVSFHRVSDGTTVIGRQYVCLPFHITRPLYLDAYWPEMAFLYIQMPTGGLAQGDRLRMEVDLEPGAVVHLTTQSASKVYGMNANLATQELQFFVADGAYLEYWPDPTIPFAGSRFFQDVQLRVARGGYVAFVDLLAPGRLARGECFAFDLYYSRLVAQDEEGKIRLRDTMAMGRQNGNPQALGVFGDFKYVATLLFLVPEEKLGGLLRGMREVLEQAESAWGGATLTPGDGVLVRFLTESGPAAAGAVERLMDRARRELFGRPGHAPRK